MAVMASVRVSARNSAMLVFLLERGSRRYTSQVSAVSC